MRTLTQRLHSLHISQSRTSPALVERGCGTGRNDQKEGEEESRQTGLTRQVSGRCSHEIVLGSLQSVPETSRSLRFQPKETGGKEGDGTLQIWKVTSFRAEGQRGDRGVVLLSRFELRRPARRYSRVFAIAVRSSDALRDRWSEMRLFGSPPTEAARTPKTTTEQDDQSLLGYLTTVCQSLSQHLPSVPDPGALQNS